MPQKLIFILLLTLAASGFLSGQTVNPAKADEADEKLRTEAVALLRETAAEVGGMRSVENRISFGAEIASLMWYSDPKEARQMYSQLISDYQMLAADLDAKLSEIAAAAAIAEEDSEPISFGLFGDPSATSTTQRKMSKVLEMRKQIAMSLAEHEPDLALDFYNGSVALLTSKFARDRAGANDKYFELQLMNQIAESNAAKAAQLALKSMDDGVEFQHIELLKKIYAKDAEKGIELAAAIAKKIKSAKDGAMGGYMVASLVHFAEETTVKPAKGEAKKPLMSSSEIRDLVEFMASRAMSSDDEASGMAAYMDLFEKYTPTRAAQIRTKFRNISVNGGNYTSSSNRAVANAMNTAANAMANTANSPDPAVTAAAERRAKAAEEKLEADRKMMEDVASLSTKTLPKEEREKIITQARKIITKTPGREQRIAALSMLASQVAKAGDRELAAEIMKDAESAAVPQPKNYQEYMLNWMLISGYADVNPDRAFTMLNETILRLNDTLAAFVKAAEFIDAPGDIISDDEVQVGQFGGSMLRSLTRELKIATPTLRSLSKANFEKTRAITNAFDRREVRVLAKMLVIRTVLDKDSGKDEAEMMKQFTMQP